MKIGLITYNRAHSYGAVLQCYATNKKLQDLEVEFETIDYNPYFFTIPLNSLDLVNPEKTVSLDTPACN